MTVRLGNWNPDKKKKMCNLRQSKNLKEVILMRFMKYGLPL